MTARAWELATTAELQNLAAILDFTVACCQQCGIDEENTFAIRLAVDEAVANVIEHAYEGTGGRLALECWSEGSDFFVQVRDWGRPFAPQSVRQPKLSGSLSRRKAGGLGLHMMRRLMDEVRFSFDEDGNALTMVKRNVAS